MMTTMMLRRVGLQVLLVIFLIETTSFKTALGAGASSSGLNDEIDDDLDDDPKIGSQTTRPRFSLNRGNKQLQKGKVNVALPPLSNESKKIESLMPYYNQVFTLTRTKLNADDVFARLQILHNHRESLSSDVMETVSSVYELNDLDPANCVLEKRIESFLESVDKPALRNYVQSRNKLQIYACFRELKNKIDLVLSRWNKQERDEIRLRFKKLKQTLMLESDDPVLMVRKFLNPSSKQILVEGMSRYVCAMGQCSNKLSTIQHQHQHNQQKQKQQLMKSSDKSRKQSSFLTPMKKDEISAPSPSSSVSLAQIIDSEEFQYRNLASQVLVQPCDEALKIWGPVKDYFDLLERQSGDLLLGWLDPFSLNAILGAHICQMIKAMQQNEILGQIWGARKETLLQANVVQNTLLQSKLKSTIKTDSSIPQVDDDDNSHGLQKLFGFKLIN